MSQVMLITKLTQEKLCGERYMEKAVLGLSIPGRSEGETISQVVERCFAAVCGRNTTFSTTSLLLSAG